MKLRFLSLLALGVATLSNTSQAAEKIKFTEYDLPNGLHVILHEKRNSNYLIESGAIFLLKLVLNLFVTSGRDNTTSVIIKMVKHVFISTR